MNIQCRTGFIVFVGLAIATTAIAQEKKIKRSDQGLLKSRNLFERQRAGEL